jgi:hypothetical protein
MTRKTLVAGGFDYFWGRDDKSSRYLGRRKQKLFKHFKILSRNFKPYAPVLMPSFI